MRNQLLTGYLLHHKPYQENRALYYFFTPTHGLVHGVGKKGMPLFTHVQLFATGKRSLKSFSQIQLVMLANTSTFNKSTSISTHSISPIELGKQLTEQNLYAGFYLNEILWKLLTTEDPMPKLWQYYHFTLNQLRLSTDTSQLKLLLRHFEQALFAELGYAISLTEDTQRQKIKSNLYYHFLTEEGFIAVSELQNDAPQFSATDTFSGASLRTLAKYLQADCEDVHLLPLDSSELQTWSRLNKLMIDHLLDYQPLNSRKLWSQFIRYR